MRLDHKNVPVQFDNDTKCGNINVDKSIIALLKKEAARQKVMQAESLAQVLGDHGEDMTFVNTAEFAEMDRIAEEFEITEED